MTLTEMKKRTLALIEEINKESKYLTDDIDIQEKINYVVDMVQNELARIKKIAVVEEMEVTEGQEMNLYEDLDNFYKLETITGVRFDMFQNNIKFEEDGTARINYYKYPKIIDTDTIDDEYEFELSQDCLEIMPYGVAADLLKSDVSAQYGQVYANAYREKLNLLELNTSNGVMEFKGGLNV